VRKDYADFVAAQRMLDELKSIEQWLAKASYVSDAYIAECERAIYLRKALGILDPEQGDTQ
jgi:hypothetical protein